MAYILQPQMLNACDWNIRRSNANKAKQDDTNKKNYALKYLAKKCDNRRPTIMLGFTFSQM